MIEKTSQIGIYPWNKVFDNGMLELRNMSIAIKDRPIGERAHSLCFGYGWLLNFLHPKCLINIHRRLMKRCLIGFYLAGRFLRLQTFRLTC